MKVAGPLEVGGVVIEEVDYRSLNDEQIALLTAFGEVLRQESAPEDPPRTVEETASDVRSLPDLIVVREFWGLDPDGGLAAQAWASWRNSEDNKHVLNCGVLVRPDHRGRGIGRAMLALIADISEAEQRPLIVATTEDRVPSGEAFARRVGADMGLATHINRLVVADVDRDLVRRWIDEGPARASEYRLETIDNPYPDDRVAAIADLSNVMNTAPRDNLQLEDRTNTPDHIRQWERSMLAAGIEGWGLYAVHEPSGELVGYTEVRWAAHRPKTVWQGDTGVRPEHRGHALGKWLKAAMLERILAERPGVEDVRTGNADSNAPMLGINNALGFRPFIAHLGWQVQLEQVRAYLGGSSD